MRFTVCIPTRNRADKLPHAVASVLAQTHDDLSLVISNNDSSDATADRIADIADDRLVALRTDRALSMVDHWNFVINEALDRTDAEWFLYLCDDDALATDALEVLAGHIARHPDLGIFRYAQETYYYDDGIEAGRANALKYRSPRPTGLDVVNARATIHRAFQTLEGDMPKLLNAAVHRSLLERLRDTHDRVFHPWAPDYSCAVLLLTLAGRFGDVREPLMVWGKNTASYGSGSRVDPDHLLEFLREFPEFDGSFPGTTWPDLVTVENMVADTLLRTRAQILDADPDADTTHMQVNRFAHAAWVAKNIREYQKHGHDRYDSALAEVERARRAAPLADRLELQRLKFAKRRARWLRALQGRKPRTLRVNGADAGFTNIAEAAAYYTDAVRPATANA